jgi:hypothetical protein
MHGSRPRRLAFTVSGLGLLLLALAATPLGAASPYPPNTVVNSYVDLRYCGGTITVVSDSGGNLIDVCSDTGQRIFPVAAAYGAPGFNGYPPAYNSGYSPVFNGNAPNVPGYDGTVYGTAGNGAIIRQYNDGNSNCPNGDVTQTVSGFFCTANGQPAASNGGVLTYNTGYAPVFNNGYVPTFNGTVPYAPGYAGTAYGTAGNGAVIRQYNDGNSNCPNGDVTQTASGFFCAANGQPAFRVR